jgi:DNA-binding transcriptional LysR family regulator
MELDYDWLFAFVVFAEHRSFTHAAEAAAEAAAAAAAA